MNDERHSHDESQPGRRPLKRRRLPVLASLHLDDGLMANEHHPLAGAAPETRAAGRLRLIAAVLARMARSALARR
jgi:hypothetical protein